MRIVRALIAAAAVVAVPIAAQLPDNWEGLAKVRSQRVDAAYLLPGVDFRAYTKVKFDPTEVAFRQNWQRDYNRASGRSTSRIDDAEAARIAAAARSGFEEIFAEAFREGGYQVVTEPGPDVLRLRTGILNLYITAPEQSLAGRVRTYSAEAGEATLFLEVRDSMTGALIGRAVDQRTAGDFAAARTQISNRADFEAMFRHWARVSVRGLDELKARSPINAGAGGR